MAPFPELPDRGGLEGMTVNERLFARGLLDQFDGAIRSGDRILMADILSRAGLSDVAEQIISTILAHPTRFGRVIPS
jgi:hypothetical protein